MSDQQTPTKHTAWIDVCRLASIFGVILIHIAAPVFNEYRTIPLDEFLTANVLNSLARVSVPLFAMLSGALLLGKDASISIVAKRVTRVLIPLVFWSFIYAFWTDPWTGKPINILGALNRMMQEPVMYHLWFVYMILGVYIVLPILRVISVALDATPKTAIYFFALWFLVNSFTLHYPIKALHYLYLSNFLGWPGYFILGHYLTRCKFVLSISARISALVFFLASLTTFFISWRLTSLSSTPSVIAFEYFSPNVVIAASAIFLWFQKIKVPDALVKPIALLSSMTFSVYFMHLIIIAILMGKNHGFGITAYFIHPAIGIVGLSILTFLTSMVIALLIRFIPFSSRVMG